MKTILIPIDFSPLSDAVVAEGAALGRAFQARMVLLHAIQPIAAAIEFVGMYGYGEEVETAEGNTHHLLAEHEARLVADGLTVETVCVTADPVSSILERARGLPADFIVMGSHGHSAFYDLLMGSTTHGVLLHAPCPVLIVRPGAGSTRRDAAAEQPTTA